MLVWAHLSSSGLLWTRLGSYEKIIFIFVIDSEKTSVFLQLTWANVGSLELLWTHLSSYGLAWAIMDNLNGFSS